MQTMSINSVYVPILLYELKYFLVSCLDIGIRTGHHSDEEVEKDNDVDETVRAEHEESPKPRERLDAGELKVEEVHQSKGCPEQ